MKSKLNLFNSTAILFALSLSSATAATNTWTGAISTNWDTATANWSSPAIWANGDDAVFNSGAGTVNVVTNITANSVTLAGAGDSINLTTGNTLLISPATAAAPPWSQITGAGTLELNSAQPIDGSDDWGIPALPGTFTGKLQVDKGRIYGVPANLGGTTAVVIGNGAQFLGFDGTENGTPYTFTQNFSINGTGHGASGFDLGAIRVSAMSATFSGNVTLTGNSALYTQQFKPTSSIYVTGVISDGGAGYGLTINAQSGAITLANQHTYTGDTTVNSGLLELQNTTAFASPTITNNAAVKFYAAIGVPISSKLSGSGTWTADGPGGGVIWDNRVILQGTGSDNTGTISVINSGKLWSEMTYSNNPIGDTANVDIATGAAFYLYGPVGAKETIGGLDGSGTVDFADGGGGKALTLELGGGGKNGSFSGNIQNSSFSNGPTVLSISKIGAGTQILSGPNSYTGDTTVNAGILAVTGSSIADTNKLVISGGTVSLAGAETVNTLFFGNVQQAAGTYSATGAGGTIASANFSGPGTLVVTSGPVAGYASWMAPFISGGLTGDTTPTGDPDNDSMNNLLEYALNGNPAVSDSTILPGLVVTATDLEFTYSRLDLSLADTVQTFEYGSTLAGWTPVLIPAGPGVSTVGIATITITNTGSTDSVKISIPRSANVGGKLFGRLNIVSAQ